MIFDVSSISSLSLVWLRLCCGWWICLVLPPFLLGVEWMTDSRFISGTEGREETPTGGQRDQGWGANRQTGKWTDYKWRVHSGYDLSRYIFSFSVGTQGQKKIISCEDDILWIMPMLSSQVEKCLLLDSLSPLFSFFFFWLICICLT